MHFPSAFELAGLRGFSSVAHSSRALAPISLLTSLSSLIDSLDFLLSGLHKEPWSHLSCNGGTVVFQRMKQQPADY